MESSIIAIHTDAFRLSLQLQGNKLLPPNSTDVDSLGSLDQRLSRTAADNWHRKDILGLLMSAYAMLLRSSPIALRSPRNAASPITNSLDVRKSSREGMEAPQEFKSFTFARLCLLVALQKPTEDASDDCNVSEFLLAALSEFASHYLFVLSSSGDRPISRAKWRQDAEEELKLRRQEAEREASFQAWSGTQRKADEPVVPDEINLLDRPDCMDDVFAFATAICSIGPQYALNFWSQDEQVSAEGETTVSLAPSVALLALRSQQAGDSTLRASYLAFLAALATARSADGSLNGSDTVHEMIMMEESQSTYSALIGTLRQVSEQLNPSSSSSSTTRSSATSSSLYYTYGFEPNQGTYAPPVARRQSSQ